MVLPLSLIALLIALNHRRLTALRDTVDAGANASVLPVLSVASLVGFGSVVAAMPAFEAVRDWVLSIEGGLLVSLAVATLVTWALNRSFTFERSGRTAIAEALRYGLVALLAQGFNYVSFLTLLHLTGATHPLRTLVATAVMTAAFSFTGQSLFSFRSANAAANSSER